MEQIAELRDRVLRGQRGTVQQLNFPGRKLTPLKPQEALDTLEPDYKGPGHRVGVKKVRGGYEAKYRRHHCGTWNTEKLAAAAHDRAALHDGEDPENLPTLARRLGKASPKALREEAAGKRKPTKAKKVLKKGKHVPSQYTGVNGLAYADGTRWSAVVFIGGESYAAGGWSTARKAAIARDRMLLYFGRDEGKLELPHLSVPLGPATPQQLRFEADNRVNKPTQYRGVSVCMVTGKFAVQFQQKFVGRFQTPEEAGKAYDAAARAAGVSEARLNFPRKR